MKPLVRQYPWLRLLLSVLTLLPLIDLADDHYKLNDWRARTLLAWEPRYSLRNTLTDRIRRGGFVCRRTALARPTTAQLWSPRPGKLRLS